MNDSRNFIMNEALRALRREVYQQKKHIERLKLRLQAERQAGKANRDEVVNYRRLIRRALT